MIEMIMHLHVVFISIARRLTIEMRMKWSSYIFFSSHYCSLHSLTIVLFFPLPIDALCDYIPARTSVQALGLLFRMAHSEIFCDTGNMKVVHPNVNIRQIEMSRMTNRDGVKSLTNAIMMDATKAFGDHSEPRHEILISSIQVLR
jgi:hypothetical protein